jgi:hypothetical protein
MNKQLSNMPFTPQQRGSDWCISPTYVNFSCFKHKKVFKKSVQTKNLLGTR